MDYFKQKILECMREAKLEFPGLDINVIADKTLASAEEYVLSNIASDLLNRADKDLFRDCFLSAPGIFDADEFLSERVANYDMQVDRYFDKWLDMFRENL